MSFHLTRCLLVKPARLHFARAARALAGRYERGVLSEYPAARARASYWFDKVLTHAARAAATPLCGRARAKGSGQSKLSSGHLLLSGDGLGLGFWVMVLE